MRVLSLPIVLLTLSAASHVSANTFNNQIDDSNLARRAYSGSSNSRGHMLRRRARRNEHALLSKRMEDMGPVQNLLHRAEADEDTTSTPLGAEAVDEEEDDDDDRSSTDTTRVSSTRTRSSESETTRDSTSRRQSSSTATERSSTISISPSAASASSERESSASTEMKSRSDAAELSSLSRAAASSSRDAAASSASLADASSLSAASALSLSLARVSSAAALNASYSLASVASASSASAASLASVESAASTASVASAESAASAAASAASAASAAAAQSASSTSADESEATQGADDSAASEMVSAFLITSSVPGGTTVITSYSTLAATGLPSFKAASSGSSSSSLSKGAIIAIATSLGTIGLIAIIFTIVRKRRQALSRTIRPLSFEPTPGYGAMSDVHSTHRGVTRTSQESWLGGGRPMSGVSEFDEDVAPPMMEQTHGYGDGRSRELSDEYYRAEGRGVISMPDAVYGAAPALSESNSLPRGGFGPSQPSQRSFASTGSGSAYYDGSAPAAYHPTAVRGHDLAHHAQDVGTASSPYADLQRGPSSSGHSNGSYHDHHYAIACGGDRDTDDPFRYPSEASRQGLGSDRWSG